MTTLLQESTDFSLKIAKAIEVSDWELLSNILTQRQARLETLLNAPSSEEEQKTTQSILASIQAMDKIFMDSIQSQKADLLRDFKTISHGQKSIRAYYSN